MSSVKTNFVWNASFQVIRIVIPLILTPYLTRTLGSDSLGIYSYTSSVATYFEIFVFLGLNQYGTREIARHSSNKEDLSRTFWSIFTMQFIWGLVVTLAYIIFCFAFSGSYFTCAIVWSFWVFGEVIDITWLFFGLEEFKITTIRNLIVRVISVICVFAFVHHPSDTWIYCCIMSLYFLFASLTLWPFVSTRVLFIKPSAHEVIVHIKPNLMLFAPVIAISLYTQLDKILLGTLSDMSQLGFYDQVEKVCQIPLSVITALGTVMLPRMSELVQHGESDTELYYLDRSMWLTNILSFAFCFGIIGIAPVFVPVFFGKEFIPCITLMSLLAFTIPIISWSNVFGIQCLLPRGKDRQYLGSVAIGALVNILSNLILIPNLQALGTVIATLITESSVTAAQMIFLRHALPLNAYFKDALPFIIIGGLMAVAVRISMLFYGVSLLGLVAGVIIGVVFYSVLSYAWLTSNHDERLGIFKLRSK